jgi:hypothetical protein
MFKPWPKITRLENKRPPIFTEKIDGTNACVVVAYQNPDANSIASYETNEGVISIWAQSRTRLITPENDNYGFAKWVRSNSEELLSLGEGYHFGEWWGQGINRGYGLTEKRFSLFNTRRWGPHNPHTPKCCHVVPIIPLYNPQDVIAKLYEYGSLAAPGWMKPEGAVMYEPDTDTCFKIIIDK